MPLMNMQKGHSSSTYDLIFVANYCSSGNELQFGFRHQQFAQAQESKALIMPASTTTAPSPWSPLRHAVFRSLWIASLVSNVGTWMQNVAGVWLMTSLNGRVTKADLQVEDRVLAFQVNGKPPTVVHLIHVDWRKEKQWEPTTDDLSENENVQKTY